MSAHAHRLHRCTPVPVHAMHSTCTELAASIRCAPEAHFSSDARPWTTLLIIRKFTAVCVQVLGEVGYFYTFSVHFFMIRPHQQSSSLMNERDEAECHGWELNLSSRLLGVDVHPSHSRSSICTSTRISVRNSIRTSIRISISIISFSKIWGTYSLQTIKHAITSPNSWQGNGRRHRPKRRRR